MGPLRGDYIKNEILRAGHSQLLFAVLRRTGSGAHKGEYREFTVGRGSKEVAICKARIETPGEITCFGILDFQ